MRIKRPQQNDTNKENSRPKKSRPGEFPGFWLVRGKLSVFMKSEIFWKIRNFIKNPKKRKVLEKNEKSRKF